MGKRLVHYAWGIRHTYREDGQLMVRMAGPNLFTTRRWARRTAKQWLALAPKNKGHRYTVVPVVVRERR